MAAKKYHYVFVVEGRITQFPIDMLRYDRCWPRTERDSAKVPAPTLFTDKLREVRDVQLCGLQEPTEGRWNSFGWTVRDVRKVEVA